MSWRPRFFEESPLFAPVVEAASLFSSHASFPSPEAIDEALAPRAKVRFVRQAPRARRRGPRPAEDMYDARIVRDGAVPTRAGSWHDLMNALVWATFPEAKRALHTRQHALVVPGASRRTREQDTLALLDEGGVLLAEGGAVVFGHAIFEGVVRGWPLPHAAGIFARGDAGFAALLCDPKVLVDPSELTRVDLAPAAPSTPFAPSP